MGKSKAREIKRLQTQGFVPCEMKQLSKGKQEAATKLAFEENPNNLPQNVTRRSELVAYRGKYWGSNGVDLTVQFLDTTNQPLIDRILSHFNAYSQFCNAKFRFVKRDGQVRVVLGTEGYWSNVGTDIPLVSKSLATMGLQRFSLSVSEEEYRRVVRHEVGHTLGFPHGHLLEPIVKRIDKQKAYKFFKSNYGWNPAVVDYNVLQPLDNDDLIGDLKPDYDSIMDYWLPDEIFIDGKGVRGGKDFTLRDMQDCSKIYPLNSPVIFGKGGQAFAVGGYVMWKNSRGDNITVKPYPGHQGIIHISSNGIHIATAPGKGGGPHIKCYNIETGQETASFLAIKPNSNKGAHVAMSYGWGQVRVSLGEGEEALYQEFDPATGRPVAGYASFGPGNAHSGMTCALWGNPNV